MRRKIENRQSKIGNGPDPRHSPIRALIVERYELANGLPVPWTGHTAKVLAAFLVSNPGWPLEALLRCVENRFMSDGVNLAEDPVRWINRLPNYVRGALNKFGEPMRGVARSDASSAAMKAWNDRVNAEAAAELAKLERGKNSEL